MIRLNEQIFKTVTERICNTHYFFKNYRTHMSKMNFKIRKNLLSYEIECDINGDISTFKIKKFSRNATSVCTIISFVCMLKCIKNDIGSESLFKNVFNYLKIPFIKKGDKLLISYMYMTMLETDDGDDLHKIVYQYLISNFKIQNMDFDKIFQEFEILYNHLQETEIIA